MRDPTADRPRARGRARVVTQEPQQRAAVCAVLRPEHLELPNHVGTERHLARVRHRAERGRQQKHAVQPELPQPVERDGDGAGCLRRQVQRASHVTR